MAVPVHRSGDPGSSSPGAPRAAAPGSASNTFLRSLSGGRRPPVLAAIAGLVVVLWLVACTAVIANPRIDEPRPADALFVLGPADDRIATAQDLLDDGTVGAVVYSVPGLDAANPPGFCAPSPRYEVHCFVPEPMTTQGEAMKLRELAAERGWNSINVLTYDAHAERARTVLERCWDEDLRMLTFPRERGLGGWLYEFVYQSAGWAKVAVTPGCDTVLPEPLQGLIDIPKPEIQPVSEAPAE